MNDVRSKFKAFINSLALKTIEIRDPIELFRH